MSEIFTPGGGEVTETNPALQILPRKSTRSAWRQRGSSKIRLADPKEVSSLMDATAYEAYIAEKAKEHSA